MVFRSLFAILDRRGIVHVDHNETYLDEVLGWTLAAVGFYFQYTQCLSASGFCRVDGVNVWEVWERETPRTLER